MWGRGGVGIGAGVAEGWSGDIGEGVGEGWCGDRGRCGGGVEWG